MSTLLVLLPIAMLVAGMPIFLILLATALVALAFVLHVPLVGAPQMMQVPAFSVIGGKMHGGARRRIALFAVQALESHLFSRVKVTRKGNARICVAAAW